MNAPVTPSSSPNPRRKKAMTAVSAVLALSAVAWGVHYFMFGRHVEQTDNAYVQANVVQITPQVGGTVLAIGADDTDLVKAGQVLVKLDPADARVALDQAEAQLAQTVREVRTLYANNETLKAQMQTREADVAKASNEVERAQDDVNRRKPLLSTGAVGQEEFNHAVAQLNTTKTALAAAKSGLAAAQEQLSSNRALTDGTTVTAHPNVARAAAKVREAYLALQRVALPAPVDGYVAKRSVQVGQRVQAGTPLMALVTLQQPWVDANFKESQLQRIRIGQPATLTADVYGEKVEFHGKVEGLGAGTGAAFALLPAQNATGNWIKVVQRVPVRIALDAAEVKAHPLRVGLSMEVAVDVSKQDGAVLSDTVRKGHALETDVFAQQQRDADALVKRIISSNLGHQASVGA
ncbi:efflux RND transporter periplasmic adaptor subunit [Aquabacterium sp.]|uniref:HlyD family secretion protein n=1 Tax=Aquabacterium sp. TaxID=1872578 RepID=UPI0035AE93F2